jgi:hypothetical protein
MSAADTAWRESLRGVSIADLVAGMNADYGPGALPVFGAWLTGSPPA